MAATIPELVPQFLRDVEEAEAAAAAAAAAETAAAAAAADKIWIDLGDPGGDEAAADALSYNYVPDITHAHAPWLLNRRIQRQRRERREGSLRAAAAADPRCSPSVIKRTVELLGESWFSGVRCGIDETTSSYDDEARRRREPAEAAAEAAAEP
jgi:hypothetical protein